MNGSVSFATDLEQCIRDQAAAVAASAADWGDRCRSLTNKMDMQVEVMHATAHKMFVVHGYTGAAWCTFYTTVMSELPYYRDWREHMLCPWFDGEDCLQDQLGKHGEEAEGVPQEWGRDKRKDGQFNRGEMRLGTRVMSCGLCGHLSRVLGTAAPFRATFPSGYHVARLQAHRESDAGVEGPDRCNPGDPLCQNWWNEWDMHTFGVWLARVSEPADVRSTGSHWAHTLPSR